MAGRSHLEDYQIDAIVADARRTVGTSEGSTRKIALRHGVTESTVRRWVSRAPDAPQFGDPQTRARMKNAIASRALTAADKRQELAEAILQELRKLMREMNAKEWKVFNFGGAFNTYEEKKIDFVPVRDRQSLATIFGILMDKYAKLDGWDADAKDADAVTAFIAAMTGRAPRQGDAP